MTADTTERGHTAHHPAAGAPAHDQEGWHAIAWPAAYQNVRRLQARIVKATQEGTGTPAPATYLLVQASQHLWLVVSNGVYQRFTSVGHTIRPSSRTA